MKTIKTIYVSILALLSLSILFMPLYINTTIEGIGFCAFMGALGIYETILFLKFNSLKTIFTKTKNNNMKTQIKFPVNSELTNKAMNEIIVQPGFGKIIRTEGEVIKRSVYEIECNDIQEFAELFMDVGAAMKNR
jgi:hypothetical protein